VGFYRTRPSQQAIFFELSLYVSDTWAGFSREHLCLLSYTFPSQPPELREARVTLGRVVKIDHFLHRFQVSLTYKFSSFSLLQIKEGETDADLL
jgi:hypothetical protein